MLRNSKRNLSTAAKSAAAPAARKPPPPRTRKDGLFDKILIANRGEITCRVINSARKLGIKTVAIYSDPDANALHVKEADEAVCVGPAPSSQSYLNVGRILDAISNTGSQAVHPGYGFLSENAAFAQILEENGIKFIGPRAFSIDAMGDKIHSKELALKAGVHTIPGFLGVLADEDEAVKVAREIGYPVMIKASGGGGGKGMRIAWNDAEAREGFKLSKQEAAASFGDDRLFVEKFIEDPRHIEIQLIADSHGNVVALPERECSIQRRNQKVIEESPSVLLDEATRKAMQQQACDLARAVGYESAGTVEFLADNKKNFYFLEMNTRLQVEHPVTEMITGVDLVDLMIRVAAGEKLPASLISAPFWGPAIKGHAFESRVYAEDPFRGFLPSTGRLGRYVEPQEFAKQDPYLAQEIRADSGVRQGSEISMFYDPMICKLVTHGPTRDSALDRMRASLDAYVIRGVGHNIPFLRDLCDHPRFMSGAITTQFIREEYPEGFQGVALGENDRELVAVAGAVMHAIREAMFAQLVPASPMPGFGTAPPSRVEVVVTLGAAEGPDKGPVYRVVAQRKAAGSDDFTATVTPLKAAGDKPLSGPAVSKTINLGRVQWNTEAPVLFAELEPGVASGGAQRDWPSEAMLRVQHVARLPDGFRLAYRGAVLDAHVRTPEVHALGEHMKAKPKRDTSKLLVAPMPGKLISVAVKPGQEVQEGQELAVVEAMKMQNVLRSPKKGIIRVVPTKAGDTLAVDQTILEFEA